ncbi:MAG: 23S rRNA (uracil(1939)-C(5))-methyltransferase RlmD [Candidatus Eremiobacteraeota bacterium]|nr:23S rRNA (uracil(1939)-C(5))-methyltransferase RlmD [Candidatus Eremiobacteraeota bacterium]
MTIKNVLPNPGGLRVGAEIELCFNDLLANGQAVGRFEGQVVFVFGPLPLERARVRVTSLKAKYAVAEMVALTDQSPHRVKPFCVVFGRCGGCQLQHLSYEAQLKWKRDTVRNALARIAGIKDAEVSSTIGLNNPKAYRNKMSLVVDRSSMNEKVGFYQQRSHRVVAIDECPIVLPQLSGYIPVLRDAVADARHIVARAGQSTGQAVVTYTTLRRSSAAARVSRWLFRKLPGAIGITNSFDLAGENAILGSKFAVLAGTEHMEERIGGIRYRISTGSFFQINSEVVSRIFLFLQNKLGATRKIVDLYCGVGTFSLFFAQRGASVWGVEENAAAIREAQFNAELNGLAPLVTLYQSRVEDAVKRNPIRAALAAADTAFLDPPRKGTDERTLAAIAAANVSNVWYLSCDAATLARDLKVLVSAGYTLHTVQPFDMFPQTGHVETLALLGKE